MTREESGVIWWQADFSVDRPLTDAINASVFIPELKDFFLAGHCVVRDGENYSIGTFRFDDDRVSVNLPAVPKTDTVHVAASGSVMVDD